MLLNDITGESNPFAGAAKVPEDSINQEVSGRRREGGQDVPMGIGMRGAVRAARAAGLGAGTQGIIDDGLDGARAPAAFGTAPEAAVNLLGITGKVFRATDRTADIVVGEDVAGTNNHENEGLIR
jgi:hypothetical protein